MKTEKKKGLLLMALALAVLVVAYVVYVSNGSGTQNEDQTATSTPDAATTTDIFDMEPIVPEAKVSTEGWKTCRNEEYGWEVKYPGEWYVYGDGHHSGVEGSTWGGYYANETPCVGRDVKIAEWEPGTGFATTLEGASVTVTAGKLDDYGTYRIHITNVRDLAESFPKLDLHGFYIMDNEEAVWLETNTISRVDVYHAHRRFQIRSLTKNSFILETMLTTFRFLDTATTTPSLR